MVGAAIFTMIGTDVVAVHGVFLDEGHFLAALRAWPAALQIAGPMLKGARASAISPGTPNSQGQ